MKTNRKMIRLALAAVFGAALPLAAAASRR